MAAAFADQIADVTEEMNANLTSHMKAHNTDLTNRTVMLAEQMSDQLAVASTRLTIQMNQMNSEITDLKNQMTDQNTALKNQINDQNTTLKNQMNDQIADLKHLINDQKSTLMNHMNDQNTTLMNHMNDQITKLTNQIGALAGTVTCVAEQNAQHSTMLGHLVVASNQHTTTLDRHSVMLERHGNVLDDHGNRLQNIATSLHVHRGCFAEMTTTLKNQGDKMDNLTATSEQQLADVQTLAFALNQNHRARWTNFFGQGWSPLVVEHQGPNTIGSLPPGHLVSLEDVQGLTNEQIEDLEFQYNLPKGYFEGDDDTNARREAVMRYHTHN